MVEEERSGKTEIRPDDQFGHPAPPGRGTELRVPTLGIARPIQVSELTVPCHRGARVPEKGWGAGLWREAQFGAYFPKSVRSPEAGGVPLAVCRPGQTDAFTGARVAHVKAHRQMHRHSILTQ